MSQTPAETKTYEGSCHCGKVRYEATCALNGAIACNCSMCRRKGTLLTFVPEEQFKLHQGEDALTDYQFGKKTIHHLFCSTCGVTSFARGSSPDGKTMIAINVRCLDGVDPEKLSLTHHDGASM
jgi:hypothetical protein